MLSQNNPRLCTEEQQYLNGFHMKGAYKVKNVLDILNVSVLTIDLIYNIILSNIC